MEKFILKSSMFVETDLETNVCLKPESLLIENYIATFKTFTNEAEAIANLDSFILEMTPLLFAEFQAMESVAQHLKESFEL